MTSTTVVAAPTTTVSRRRRAPRRLFLSELPTSTATAASPTAALPQQCDGQSSFRLVGTLVDAVIRKDHPEDMIVMDDGTASVAIATPSHMLARLDWSLGCTLDAVVVETQRNSVFGGSNQTPTAASSIEWEADSIGILTDPHAAALRTLELCYQRDARYDAPSCRWGYPNPSMHDDFTGGTSASLETDAGITSDELYEVICASGCCERPNQPDSNLSANRCHQGCALEQLVTVLQIPSEELKSLITNLQLSGQLYQDEQGNYAPL